MSAYSSDVARCLYSSLMSWYAIYNSSALTSWLIGFPLCIAPWSLALVLPRFFFDGLLVPYVSVCNMRCSFGGIGIPNNVVTTICSASAALLLLVGASYREAAAGAPSPSSTCGGANRMEQPRNRTADAIHVHCGCCCREEERAVVVGGVGRWLRMRASERRARM